MKNKIWYLKKTQQQDGLMWPDYFASAFKACATLSQGEDAESGWTKGCLCFWMFWRWALQS